MAIPFLPRTTTSPDAPALAFLSSPPPRELNARAALARVKRQSDTMQQHQRDQGQGPYYPRPSSRARPHRPQIAQLKHDGASASASASGTGTGMMAHRSRGHDLDPINPGCGDFEQRPYPPSPAVHELISEEVPSPPDSPISPRWDSLPNYPNLSAVPYERVGTPSNPNSPVRTRFGPSPGLGPPPYSAGRASPYGSESSRLNGYGKPARQFPLIGTSDAQRRPMTPSSSAPLSSQNDTFDSRPSTGTSSSMVENFSRPRKPSMRQGPDEAPFPRTRAGNLARSESAPPLEYRAPYPSQHGSPSQHSWSRGRGNSGASAQSAGTFGSLAHRPSNEQLYGSRVPPLRFPSPSPTSAPRAPPPAPAPAQGLNTIPPLGRDVTPWMGSGGEETRSSFRSQLTASTAQGTLFTVGTERSSVLTKYSSVTESLIINNYVRSSIRTNSVVDDGPSVEDVMGLYEKGFLDDESDEEDDPRLNVAEKGFDDDNDTHELDVGMNVPELEVSRLGSAHSAHSQDSGGVGAKMLEAMSDPLPRAGELAVPDSKHITIRDSAAMFRVSGLPSSVPKDVGLGLAEEAMTRWRKEVADSGVARHDSGKMFEGDGNSKSQQSKVAVNPEMERTNSPSPTPSASSKASEASPKALEASPPTSPIKTPAVQLPQEPLEEPDSRDRYGFRKANNYITHEQYDAWNGPYTEYLARRRKKWVAFLKENSLMTERPNRFPPRSAKTKRFIRKGIPPDWRGSAWFYYAGGPAIMAKHHGVYDELLDRAGLDPSADGKIVNVDTELKPHIVDDIEKDLHRTFPDNHRFKPGRTAESLKTHSEDSQATLTNDPSQQYTPGQTGPETQIISSLRRVLHAFALYNPRIGYCQSLNFLAGLLLLFVESEEHAFWLLNVITRVYLPGTHETSLEGSKVDLGVLMESLKDSMPSVWKHIAADEADVTLSATKKGRGRKAVKANDPNRLPPITLCLTSWFMSCFIGNLPIESVLRVWDVFFYEGSRTLFRISLAIFKMGEPEIKKCADPMEMFSVVQAIPRRLLDCNALMEACYKRRNGIGHISQDVVEERRLEARNGIRVWKAEQEAAKLAVSSPMSETAAGLDLAGGSRHGETGEVRRKNTLFGRRKEKDREQVRAAEVV